MPIPVQPGTKAVMGLAHDLEAVQVMTLMAIYGLAAGLPSPIIAVSQNY